MKIIKNTVITILLLLFAGMVNAAPRVLDTIVIEVSNKIITANEIKLAIAAVKQQRRLQNLADITDEQAAAEIIREKVNNLLLDAEAERYNIQVSQQELNAEVDRYKKTIGKSPEDSLEDVLKYLNKTPADFKAEIYKNILRSKLIGSEVYAKINITEDSLRELYSGSQGESYVYTVRHIMRRIPSAADDAAKQKAREEIEYIAEELKADRSNWDTLAKTYSDDPSAKENLGKLAPFKKGQIISQLSDRIATMTVGEVAYPVESPFGYHLIELLDKQNDAADDFDKVKDKLFKEEQSRQYKIYFTALIEKLKARYSIRLFDPSLKKYIPNYRIRQS